MFDARCVVAEVFRNNTGREFCDVEGILVLLSSIPRFGFPVGGYALDKFRVRQLHQGKALAISIFFMS